METGRGRLLQVDAGARPVVLVDEARLLEAALSAALELLASPVFLVDDEQRVIKANEAGRQLLREQPEPTRAAIGQRLTGQAEPAAVSLSAAGAPGHHLVSLPLEGGAIDAAAASLRMQHQLTKRQTEVLSLVVQGLANRDIAEKLGCSLRTVEIHLSAVFRKTGQQSRTKLVKWFYRR
jgi:DNA-binding NarL/FixJ family response regulator